MSSEHYVMRIVFIEGGQCACFCQGLVLEQTEPVLQPEPVAALEHFSANTCH